MKRLAILGSILVAGMTAVVAYGQGRALPGITDIEKVSEHVYRIPGAGGNTVVFLRSDGVVLVDTKLPQNGESILAQVRKITDKPVTMIINTHSHPDHMGSNTEIDTAANNVQVVTQARSAARMAKLPNGGTVDRTFDDRLTLGAGADRIDLYYFGAGHTDGDAFVVFPADRTMAAGDIYAWHMSPLIDPGSGGSMLAAATTLTDAFYGIKGVDHVITGHHKVYSWEDFRSYMQFNRAVVDVAKQTVAKGGTPEQALEQLAANPSFQVFMSDVVTPEINYGGSPRSRSLIALNVAFQEIRGEPVTTQWGPRPAAPPAGGAPGGGGARPDDHDHEHY